MIMIFSRQAQILARSYPTISKVESRMLSSQTTLAISKLRNALEDYRQAHYTREIPYRFKKEVVMAATTLTASDRVVVVEGMQRVLVNIGAHGRVSSTEMQSIFEELGNENGEISAQKMIQML